MARLPCPGACVWVPNNPVMRAAGVPDSYEDAMAHFEAVVGDVGPGLDDRASARLPHRGTRDGLVPAATRRPLRLLPGLQRLLLERQGRPRPRTRASNRFPSTAGCSGEWLAKLQPGLAQSLGLAVMTNEARSLSNYNRSLGAFAVSARVVLRTYLARRPASGVADQRSLADRADGQGRTRARRPDLDRCAARGPRSSRTAAWSGSAPCATASRCLVRARLGVRPGGRRLRPQRRDARARTAATSRTGPGGRSPTRATPGEATRGGDAASAPRPT